MARVDWLGIEFLLGGGEEGEEERRDGEGGWGGREGEEGFGGRGRNQTAIFSRAFINMNHPWKQLQYSNFPETNQS